MGISESLLFQCECTPQQQSEQSLTNSTMVYVPAHIVDETLQLNNQEVIIYHVLYRSSHVHSSLSSYMQCTVQAARSGSTCSMKTLLIDVVNVIDHYALNNAALMMASGYKLVIECALGIYGDILHLIMQPSGTKCPRASVQYNIVQIPCACAITNTYYSL